ncbi:fungal-specific transcription factor domain-containing protein [Xylogone sp. PMI_703]|nr:fungal-specific transcription factor domain-containing protein [Xylogone sp. PMI_703]
MVPEKENLRKTRKRGQNTKDGCNTCKVRRKKCDETRPACLRCTSTGRICDLLTSRPTRNSKTQTPNHSSSTSPATVTAVTNSHAALSVSYPRLNLAAVFSLPSQLAIRSQQESQYFDFFRSRCIRDFSTCCSEYLWKQVILQACSNEPFILHAVLAISALYRSHLQSINQLAQTESNPVEYSLKQYNLAIQSLRAKLQNGGELREAVLACLLFVSIEICQGRDSSAMVHIKNGEDLLKAISATKQYGSGSDGFDEIVSTYARISFQGRTFCGLISTSYSEVYAVRPRFSCYNDALVDLNEISRSIMYFIRRYDYEELKTLPERPLPSIVLTELCQLQATLRTWLETLETFISDEETVGRKPRPVIDLLKANHLFARIYISTRFFHSQLIFDQYIDLFKDMLGMITKVVDSGLMDQVETRGHCFHPNIASSMPLYFAGCKCREPKVRRDIISLLKRIGNEEGLYTGKTVAKVVEWVTKVEEDGSPDEFVGEKKRLDDVNFDFNLNMTGKVSAKRRKENGEWEYLYGDLVLK